ncbi:MAG: PPOX class F420-dependent oxidoreductase [Dehalococcoidia bacterium]|nr:PPOX class F420-dependent oxidoreductase [Dehalococcoidia bacterium]MDW8119468.1 PPOX class F420-dependent oxidoreductase [Chloroflexota bacterium]
MPVALSAGVKALLEKPVFAHLATIMRDGSPQVTPVWVDTDGTYILVNTAQGRVKERNVRRDNRVALSAVDPQDPYRRLQVRGRVVEVRTQGAVEHIHKLSHKYRGQPYPLRPGEQRVILVIAPEHISGNIG